MKWEVDVVSMSFGFPQKDHLISDAIAEVKKYRNGAIIFLASPGNDSNSPEAYPARDDNVISIFGTSSTGKFLETNPYPWNQTQFSLGTYGDNIPERILVDIRERFPEFDLNSGTSVATAVAAGIAGVMLAYAALLPHVLEVADNIHKVCDVYPELKTTEGMRCMLKGMAPVKNGDQYFVNPIAFWKDTRGSKSKDVAMLRKILRELPTPLSE
jgi:hypothetical protein